MRERSDAKRLVSLAVTLWLTAMAVVSVRAVIQPRRHSVYPVFIGAARDWLAGHQIYIKGRVLDGSMDDFRYSPLTAVLLTPLTLVPDEVGGMIWRALNAGVLVWGMLWCCRAVFPLLLTRGQQSLLFLLVLPFALGNFNNGQANPLSLGLIMCGVAAVAEKRWNWAAACITLACLLKIYPIAPALLLIILYPRQLASRLVICLGVGMIVPFCFQSRSYVCTQYASWVVGLTGDDRHARPLNLCYRDLQLLCRVWLTPISLRLYRLIEIAAGAAVGVLCLLGRRAGWPEIRLLHFVLGLACGWMTVFGPATEACTYLLLGPVLAYGLIEAWVTRQPHWVTGLLLASYALFMLSSIELWFPFGMVLRAHGVQPFAGMLYLAGLLSSHFVKVKQVAETSEGHSAWFAQAA
ncbi:MAG TPA: glycosyltransferase family 87 protein [Gemmataceae bacterium]|nr:glycosyltransferase family 87 protein [Gemmataceae bacterium]